MFPWTRTRCRRLPRSTTNAYVGDAPPVKLIVTWWPSFSGAMTSALIPEHATMVGGSEEAAKPLKG